MSSEDLYKNNPLHGVKLDDVVKQLVDHYGWEILSAYLNLNCFKNNPNIPATLKFLRKTPWAKDKVEAFYMYQYKNLPRASDKEFAKPPRDRIVPLTDKPGEPAELSLEDAERLRLKRAEKTRQRTAVAPSRQSSGSKAKFDPWSTVSVKK